MSKKYPFSVSLLSKKLSNIAVPQNPWAIVDVMYYFRTVFLKQFLEESYFELSTLTSANLKVKVGMKYFLEREGFFRKRGILCFNMKFLEKKQKIFTMLCSFFEFSKSFFWNVKSMFHFHWYRQKHIFKTNIG